MNVKDLCQKMLVNGIKWELESNDEIALDPVNVVGYVEKVLGISDEEQDLLMDELMSRASDDENGWIETEEQVEITVQFLETRGYFAD